MNILSILLLLALVAMAVVAVLNWAALSQISLVELGVTQVEAPLGIIMLGLTGVMALLFLAWVLWMQGKVLVEARRHAKEMQEQRTLADKAEASRFTELRQFLERQQQTADQQFQDRFQSLEQHLQRSIEEHSNTMLAHVANLETQWEQWGRGSRPERNVHQGVIPESQPTTPPSSSSTAGYVEEGSTDLDAGSRFHPAKDPLQDVVPDTPPPSGLARFIGKQGFFKR